MTPIEATASQADGVKRVSEILLAASYARWPMYLRNVKQLLRAAEGAFDERRYGFGGLVDLARACQRDGLVRLERDRRGGLRVFPGPVLQRSLPQRSTTTESAAARPAPEHGEQAAGQPSGGFVQEPVEVDPGKAFELGEATDAVETEPSERMPTVDPTAQLLGTSTRRRRPSTRRAPPAAKKSNVKKPATRRSRTKSEGG
jgi:hypothetical protein